MAWMFCSSSSLSSSSSSSSSWSWWWSWSWSWSSSSSSSSSSSLLSTSSSYCSCCYCCCCCRSSFKMVFQPFHWMGKLGIQISWTWRNGRGPRWSLLVTSQGWGCLTTAGVKLYILFTSGPKSIWTSGPFLSGFICHQWLHVLPMIYERLPSLKTTSTSSVAVSIQYISQYHPCQPGLKIFDYALRRLPPKIVTN